MYPTSTPNRELYAILILADIFYIYNDDVHEYPTIIPGPKFPPEIVIYDTIVLFSILILLLLLNPKNSAVH